jgi:hypothetical protein
MAEGHPHPRQAELAALEVSALRDEGAADPAIPSFLESASPPTAPDETIEKVFAGYRAELRRAGKGRDSESRWAPIVESLVKFLGHDSAGRITRRDVVRWKDHLPQRHAAKPDPQWFGRSRLSLARTCAGADTPNLVPALALSLRKEPKRPVKADRITPAEPARQQGWVRLVDSKVHTHGLSFRPQGRSYGLFHPPHGHENTSSACLDAVVGDRIRFSLHEEHAKNIMRDSSWQSL